MTSLSSELLAAACAACGRSVCSARQCQQSCCGQQHLHIEGADEGATADGWRRGAGVGGQVPGRLDGGLDAPLAEGERQDARDAGRGVTGAQRVGVREACTRGETN
jgi:hypothetical protein